MKTEENEDAIWFEFTGAKRRKLTKPGVATNG